MWSMHHPTPKNVKTFECLGGGGAGGGGLDIINNLHPEIITEKILCHLPIQDLLKTSILSRKWRYLWAYTPVIAFDEHDKLMFYYRKDFVNVIFHVLLLHKGPLVDFTLSAKVDGKRGIHDHHIDQIILYLSRSNTLRNFTLLNTNPPLQHYRMPSSFILSILKELQHLYLKNCVFETPLTFHDQLSKLTYLKFENVDIYAKTLKSILANCPLLKQLYLIGYNKFITTENALTIVEFLECLQPSIEFLTISDYYLLYFVYRRMPHKLPVSLLHLKELGMSVWPMDKDHFSFVLCLIKSFPNLKRLYISVRKYEYMFPDRLGDYNEQLGHGVQISMRFFGLEDYNLESLEELEVRHFKNLPIDVEFLKVVISKSSMLKKVIVFHNNIFTADEEHMISRDLKQSSSFQRCSSRNLAKVIIKREK